MGEPRSTLQGRRSVPVIPGSLVPALLIHGMMLALHAPKPNTAAVGAWAEGCRYM